MELMTIVSGLVVVGLAYILWIWWIDGKTWEPLVGRVRTRVQSALGVVSYDEMSVMKQRFTHKEQEWESRLSRLEANATFSQQLQYVSKEFERRLTELEQSEDSVPISNNTRPIVRPRSIVRLGVRLTLSDGLWAHLGAECVEEMEDHLIDAMVQGPFCPICLKRVVRRDHSKLVEVPGKCRFCGVSWDDPEAEKFPMQLIDLKRQVFKQLDQEYRAGGTMY